MEKKATNNIHFWRCSSYETQRNQQTHFGLDRFFNLMNFKLRHGATGEYRNGKASGPYRMKLKVPFLAGTLPTSAATTSIKRDLSFLLSATVLLEKTKKYTRKKSWSYGKTRKHPCTFTGKKWKISSIAATGNLVIELYASTKDELFSKDPLVVSIDGIPRTVKPGNRVTLMPGESICLEPGTYHRFFGEPKKGTVLVGEVSSVNNDTEDNRFYELQGRFPEIEEDVEPKYLLATDYEKYINKLNKSKSLRFPIYVALKLPHI